MDNGARVGMPEPPFKMKERPLNEEEKKDKEQQKQYNERVQCISKITGVPIHEVDRIFNYVGTLVQRHGEDIKLDIYDISNAVKVKTARIAAIMECIGIINANDAQWKHVIKKAKIR